MDIRPCIYCGETEATHLHGGLCHEPENVYGFFHGGDPRDFWPDAECCSKDELENHRRACELWDIANADGYDPNPEACPSGWVYDEFGNRICHVLRAPYGIGSYQFSTSYTPEDHAQ